MISDEKQDTEPGTGSKTRFDTSRVEQTYKEVELRVINLVKNELRRQKNMLISIPVISDREDDAIVRELLLKITAHELEKMNQDDLAETLKRDQHKAKIKDKSQRIYELAQGTPTLLNEIHTELCITKGWSEDVNNEHEVRQIEAASRRSAAKERIIKCNEIFKTRDKPIRTVLTRGVAGIGKTVTVQKFLSDWAEEKANQDITFMFPLPFRELNLMKLKTLSLINLLHFFFPETKELKLFNCEADNVIFIFDGLDECQLPLDFQNNQRLCDVTESVSLDVLLTNLIKGNLLPSALLWITSRPTAAHKIPSECVDLVTDVQGFSDPQKDEYFRKSISDQSLANETISHMKSSRSLYIMCHIPVFCWMSATVLEKMLGAKSGEWSGETPKTLTQMFTQFLIFQFKHKDQMYHQKCDPDPQQIRKIILALGKLAFHQLEKGNLVFYEEDLKECGIDVREAEVYLDIHTQIFKEEFDLYLGKVFSFIHLSAQEYLAALYAFVSFTNRNLAEQPATFLSDLFNNSTMTNFLTRAVDEALQSKNGHLDLFLRFLLGLSLDSNQTLLQSLLLQTRSMSHSKELTVRYIKKKIQENLSVEKSVNLFHCLDELNDSCIVQEIQTYLKPKQYSCLRNTKFSSIQWSALVFLLLNSTHDLNEFDLRTYDRTEECLLRLLPVVKESRKAVLSDCKLSVGSCRALAGVLSSNSSILIELDLSDNKLKDEGVDLLSVGLKCEQCKLEILWLKHCGISDEGYVALAVALRSNPMSNLRELNLNCNEPGDRGVKMLSDLKENTNYRLQSLSIVPDPYEMDKGYQSYIFNKASNLDMDLFYFIKSQKHCQRTFQTYDL